jgi:hypothetical protein
MYDPRLFRRRLALRILGLVGVASAAACTGGGGDAPTNAASGAGAATSSTVTGATKHAGAGGAIVAGTTGGTGGGGGLVFDASIGSGGSGGGDVPTEHACFAWPPDGGYPMAPDAGGDAGPMLPFDAGPPTDACPTDLSLIIYEIIGNSCVNGGWDPYALVSGPTRDANNQCCYVVDLRLCVGGGRPYLMEDRACLSALARGAEGWAPARVDDGRAAGVPRDGLTAETRAALADAWAGDALREHASVASFSRFSLELLAVGAPASLVEQAHRAALDEIRHAELCFALASGYAGEALAPGPFPLGDEMRLGASLAELAASTVKEGCVGEKVAAVTAAEQLARATDPEVRAALERIAADEARHAELAWRTVAWALQAGGSPVRAAVARAFVEALAGLAGGVEAAGGGGSGLESHGRLDAATAARVATSALVEVVGPAAKALLGGAPRRASASAVAAAS